MELRHLRYFVAVAEGLNFTRAAEKLFIAQPPLTRAIKQLEQEIGAELFIRKPRGLELTTGGVYFLEQARQILDKANAAVNDTRRIAENRKTVFAIGFVPSVFYGQLPLMVRRLRRNKNLEIILHEMKTQEQVDALKAGKIDIGFGRVRIEDPDVEQELLFDEPLIAAVPAGSPITRHPPSMTELSEWPMIAFPSSVGPNFTELTQGLFHRRGLRINVIQRVNDLQTALSLVASDMGFTLVPEQVKRLQREGVVYMSLEDDNINVPVIASRRQGENPNSVMRLANTILAELVENRLAGRYP
ncbi:transcriptional regulator [Marinobacter psychrophilus]|uniref:Transcriptional regulator n=1 Tax=Marinobacter psychrophilus TaxID=330734 RepID=A0A0H4I0U8_9GAMM|nr:LysR family transcriptional regulator [Marinobacter psychrophilus]AKO51215.1 transcriptional regulator [Marinobacter psychrophilus]MBQ0761847.1 LysR family transcriptional regulator [Marinobacter psychrophilus]MBQ0846505.1 LysR family transcriptional regulator [Marinobacter psychrophilus]